VIVAVFGTERFVVGTAAVRWELFTNVVVSAAPFQYTVDPLTNPSPVTVNVYGDALGTVADGVIGYSIGTGFGDAPDRAEPGTTSSSKAMTATTVLRTFLDVILDSFCAPHPFCRSDLL
jgi:hypothetical protein